MKKFLIFFVGLILIINTAATQDEKELLGEIFEEDRAAKMTTTIRKTTPSKTNKKTKIKRIDRARDYHQRTWDRSKRQVTKPRVMPRTSTKRAPVKRSTKKS